jgi:hypothetical protein
VPTIRLLTWKLHNTNDKAVEDLGKLIAAYQPDICCIQEAAPDIVRTLDGYDSGVTGDLNSRGGDGLEIAWRTDLFHLDEGGKHYSDDETTNTPYRVILAHKPSGKPFNVTTWHAPGEQVGGKYASAQPWLQTYYNGNPDELAQVFNGDGFWIVAGGFNLTASELNSCPLGLKDTYKAVHNSDPLTLDHVIIKSPVCKHANVVPISDNLIDAGGNESGSDARRPLIVDIEW